MKRAESSSGQRLQAAGIRAVDAHQRIQSSVARVLDDFDEETSPESGPIEVIGSVRRRSIVSG